MKTLFISLLSFAVSFSSLAQAPVRVKTYKKKNGTVVHSHIRTSSNSTKLDNYSTKPNKNPFTGKKGYKK